MNLQDLKDKLDKHAWHLLGSNKLLWSIHDSTELPIFGTVKISFDMNLFYFYWDCLNTLIELRKEEKL